MAARRVLAFDFGASSGRAILAEYNGEKIQMRELHRFNNDPVKLGDVFYWDIVRLMFEIKQGITKAVHEGGFDAVGIDTWGVDFGLLDGNGRLLANPVHYRDERTAGMMEQVFGRIPKEELYERTGTQFMRFNTIFQLAYLSMHDRDTLKRADIMLMIPDLMAYFLTGEKRAEYTEVSTSQCLDPVTGNWTYDLMRRLGIPDSIFPQIIDPGDQYGVLSDEICAELGCPKVPVIAVCTHDTGSAVAAVPTQAEDFIYISCGTWSLFGTELPAPVINEVTQEYNFTNEGGYGRTARLLKNIMGLWLIQESRRQWMREGAEVSYADLEQEALAAEPMKFFVDPDYSDFDTPGDLPRRIVAFCERTEQGTPETRGEIMRCIYESLAMKYRHVFAQICEITGKDYTAIHMIGGGTKDRLLCSMAANACNCAVAAGPIEATAMGNIAVQLISLGELSGLSEARKVIAASEELKRYVPDADEAAKWDAAYKRFKTILV